MIDVKRTLIECELTSEGAEADGWADELDEDAQLPEQPEDPNAARRFWPRSMPICLLPVFLASPFDQ